MSTFFQNITSPEAHGGFTQAQPYSILLAIILGTLAIRHWLLHLPKTAKFPLFNPVKGVNLTDIAQRRHFAAHGAQILKEAETANPDRPFNIMTDTGEITVLPAMMADKLRNDPNLNFLTLAVEDTHSNLSGFEAFATLREEQLFLTVINKHLTKHLNKITKPLSSEASHAVEVGLGSSHEWKTIAAYQHMLDIVARMSSRMFLGEELCRDPDWLGVTKMYTVLAFQTSDVLREYPSWLRPIMNMVLPQCKEVRELGARAKNIVRPVIRKRQMAREEAIRNGKPIPRFEDAMDWFEQEGADPKIDPALLQLMLSMAAIHTTTDLLTETMFHLSQRPELVEELRTEITDVLNTEGWKKTSLYNMKLLDSVIKETQRLKPIQLVSMNRRVLVDTKLPTGEVIPKGARIGTATSLSVDPDHYEDPLTYNGHRFMDWRGTDRDSASNLVSTGPASMGFGHGRHSCPGRFFASNEIKVALCHLLMKYDWNMAPDQNIDAKIVGFGQTANPQAEVMMRKRAEIELDIDSIQ